MPSSLCHAVCSWRCKVVALLQAYRQTFSIINDGGGTTWPLVIYPQCTVYFDRGILNRLLLYCRNLLELSVLQKYVDLFLTNHLSIYPHQNLLTLKIEVARSSETLRKNIILTRRPLFDWLFFISRDKTTRRKTRISIRSQFLLPELCFWFHKSGTRR